MSSDVPTILLVDDDKVDVQALKRAFLKLDIANPVREASNGIEALDILRGTNGQSKIASPYVVIFDLNMPCMGGIELLGEVRDDPTLAGSLMIVMTTSAAEQDLVRAYDKNVAGYILKSSSVASFQSAVSVLERYLRIIELPG